MKYLALGLAAFAVLLSLVALSQPAQVERIIERVVGGASDTADFPFWFRESVNFGGDVTTISSLATTTLTAAQLCNSSALSITSTASSGAYTMPSAAAIFADCLKENGQWRTIWIDNGGVATSSAQLAAGASTTLISEAVGGDDINGGNTGYLRLLRVSATEMIAYVSELVDSD